MAIEKYLDNGYFRLGAIGERFFRASYIDIHQNIVTVDSQFGAAHLLYELEVAILKDIHKDIEALRLFQKENGRSVPTGFPLGDKGVPLDTLLAGNAFVLVFKDGTGCGRIHALVYQIGHRETPGEKSKKASPGIYVRRGFASSLFQALDRAKDDNEPVSFDLSSDFPERFCKNRF